MFYFTLCQADVRVYISILLICFCSFDLFCPLLEKDIFIEIVYIVSSCPIKQRSFRSLIFFWLSLVFFGLVWGGGGVFLSCLVVLLGFFGIVFV